MTKRAKKRPWTFYVATAWACGWCLYSIAEWLVGAPKPSEWLVWGTMLPFFLLWWYNGMLEADAQVDAEKHTIRAEVRAEVARMTNGKIAKRGSVIDAAAEDEQCGTAG